MRTALLLLVFGALFLLGLGEYGLIDRDEAAYAEVTREMLVRGDLLVPHYNGDEIFDKPPLLYWIQAAGYGLFGVGEVGARFGNALAALLTVLCLYGFARRPLGPRAAFVSAAVMGSSLLFVALARLALMDMLLLLSLVVTLGALHRAVAAAQRPGSVAGSRLAGTGWIALAGAAAGVGTLAKGVIGLALPGVTGAAWLLAIGAGRLALRPAWLAVGAMLALGIGGSWYLLLGWLHPGGFAFMQELFVENHLERLAEPMQGHGGPFFYYVPVLIVGFLPWSLLLPLAIARPPTPWLPLRDEPARFVGLFAASAIVTFLLFSAAATKLPHYLLPVLPGVALPVGRLLADRDQEARLGDRAWGWSLGGTAALLALVAAGVLAVPWVLARLPGWIGEGVKHAPALAYGIPLGAVPAIGAGVALAGAVALMVLRRRRRLEAVTGCLLATGLALWACVVFGALPRVSDELLAPLEELARRSGSLTRADEPVVLLGIKHKPSVQFHARRRTEYARPREAGARLFGASAPRVVITTDVDLARLHGQGPFEVLERDRGYVLLRSHPGATGGGG